MFIHVILGMLRDGTQRHGYELMVQYHRRSGNRVSPGNLYRDLTRLVKGGLVETGTNPPDADPRRIPYHIADRGRQAFDTWLLALTRRPEDIENWLLFMDRVPPESRIATLERYRDDLMLRNKLIARDRDDALRALRKGSDTAEPALPVVLSRRLKRISSEIEFIDELIQPGPLRRNDQSAPSVMSQSGELRDRTSIRSRRLRGRK